MGEGIEGAGAGQRADNEKVALRASPIRETLGIRYLRVSPGRITAQFRAGHPFTNANGTVQGGILCAFLDHVMGQSAYTLVGPDERLTTVEISLKFMDPLRPGDIRGEGWVVKRGHAIFFCEGQVYSPGGETALKASSTLLLSRASRPPYDDPSASTS